MKKGNVCVGIAIATVMIAVLAISGCVEDVRNLGEKEYHVCPLVGDTEPIGDTKYFLELEAVRTFASGFGTDQAVICIYHGLHPQSKSKIEQQRVLIDKPVEIGKLEITLNYVDKEDEYADFVVIVSDTEVDIEPAIKAGETIKKVAEGVIESATSS